MTALRRQPLDFSVSIEAADFDAGAPASGAGGTSANPQKLFAGPDPELHGVARQAYWWALLVPLFWGVGLLAYGQMVGRPQDAVQSPLIHAALLFALTLTPVGVALFGAFVLRQGARLAEEARLTRIVAEEMATPALISAALSNRAMFDVAEQIAATEAAARATREELAAIRAALAEDTRVYVEATAQAAEAATRSARQELLALQTVLAEESGPLVEAAAQAAESGDRLRRQLGGERVALEALSAQLATQAEGIEDTLKRSAAAIADASELTQAQLGEAEAALAARAASLDAVSAAAADAGRVANEDLTRQAVRLEDSATTVAEQMRQVEDGLNAQRTALTETAAALAGEQERRAEEAETLRARLEDALIAARFGAVDVREQAAQAAESVRELLSAAGDQLEAMTVEARDRRQILEVETREALALADEAFAAHRATLERDLSTLADGMTNVAEVAVRSAELFGETARGRLDDLQAAAAAADDSVAQALDRRLEEARTALDQLAEASFAAARQADAHFESRLNTARRLVDRSAALVDDAGERTAARIEAGAALAKSALSDLQGGLDTLGERLERVPLEARTATDQLARDLDSLVAAARDAADETRAIDEAFQERIRRNYEVLSQAVKLMSEVTARAAAEPVAPPPVAAALGPVAAPPPPAPAPAPQPAPPARSRLRLTPTPHPEPELATATNDEFQDLFVQAGGPPVTDGEPLLEPGTETDGWTWRGLLNSEEARQPAKPARAKSA